MQLLVFCYVDHHHSDDAQYLLFPFAAFLTCVPFCHHHQDPTPLLLLLLLLLLLMLMSPLILLAADAAAAIRCGIA